MLHTIRIAVSQRLRSHSPATSQQTGAAAPHGSSRSAEMDKNAIAEVLAAVKAAGRTSLSAPEAKLVCDACAIAVPKEGLATSAKQAATIADEIGYPVVMKVVSPEILHKTEAGGVIANLTKAAEVRGAYKTIIGNAKSYAPNAHIDGVQ